MLSKISLCYFKPQQAVSIYLQQLPIKRTTRENLESVALQRFQGFLWFGVEREAL
ncbi:hypothetical protein [Pseudanabaena sp. ABRG5-3]|uniref:hypothetical protein n=1 Tax=Pseudanabaena sp. ABRG5-3 TaxID=685565 RepID=UPI0013A5FCEE|nr:hypothetical protein [Pseudanabaena sp. ABRG5-3]